jgi:hypothetical protein
MLSSSPTSRKEREKWGSRLPKIPAQAELGRGTLESNVDAIGRATRQAVSLKEQSRERSKELGWGCDAQRCALRNRLGEMLGVVS